MEGVGFDDPILEHLDAEGVKDIFDYARAGVGSEERKAAAARVRASLQSANESF
jgi:hypothetical protein